MEIIQEWMSSFLFSVVLAADLIVDIFFWMSAFFATYFLLVRLKESFGLFGGWKPIARFYFHRWIRLFPSMLLSLLFFWKFLPLFGGSGPIFFMLQTTTDCSKFWFWHITFLNNVIPWATQDTCMPWTWYLANDF